MSNQNSLTDGQRQQNAERLRQAIKKNTYIFLESLDKLSEVIRATNLNNGFELTQQHHWPIGENQKPDYRKLGLNLALIHSEVSEALEELRKGTREAFLEELADTLIRVLDTAGGLDTDIPFPIIVIEKMLANSRRPFKHGKRC